MTTLIVLASAQAVVMGADSLGTDSRLMVNPSAIAEKYFDPGNGYKLRLDKDGKPLLDTALKLAADAERVPYNQLHHVNKLFRLGTLPIGCAFTGAMAVGHRMVRSLISEFVENDEAISKGKKNYTVHTVAERLLAFLKAQFDAEYAQDILKPDLELLVAGYDRNGQTPSIFRVNIKNNTVEKAFASGSPYGVVFGGQTDWIQRIVFGTDTDNRVRLIERCSELLERYRQYVQAALESSGISFNVPGPETFGRQLWVFEGWQLNQLQSDWASFSEQNAIDCVNFFLTIMFRAQDISSQLPTVGPPVHIAVIRKDGYYPATKEVWTVGDHEVAIPEVGR